jgi:hypothetical protein
MDKNTEFNFEPVGALYLGMLGTVKLREHHPAIHGIYLLPNNATALLYGKTSEGLFVVVHSGPGETYEVREGRIMVPVGVYQGWCHALLKQQRELKKAEFGSKY